MAGIICSQETKLYRELVMPAASMLNQEPSVNTHLSFDGHQRFIQVS